MELTKLFQAARDAVGVRRVFGEPVEQGEITLIPAATVIGAAGSGGGEGFPDPDADATPKGGKGPGPPGASSAGIGGGMGYAVLGWPSGAYEIRAGGARWIPALDLNRLALLGFLLIALLLRAQRS